MSSMIKEEKKKEGKRQKADKGDEQPKGKRYTAWKGKKKKVADSNISLDRL